MTLRVPTPANQGAQQLGGAQAQAADTPFQNLRLPDLAFNARLLSQIGGDAVRLGEYFQEQEDERLLLQLQAGLGEWERQTLYGEMPDGTGAPEGGVLALEGEAAFGLTERMQQQFDARLSEFNETLGGLSASGRLAAQRYAQSRREALLDRATRIEFEQREAYNRQLRAQAASAARAAAATEWYSDEAMAAAEARLISSVTNQAADAVAAGTAATQAGIAEGSIPPWARADLPATGEEVQQDVARTVDNMVGQELDDFRRRAIETAVLEGNVVRAREIFDRAFADRLPALQEEARVGTGPQNTEWNRLLNIVTNAEERDVTMAVAGDLFAQFPDDLGAALEEVRSRGYPGEAEYYIVQELERRYSQAESAARQDRERELTELEVLADRGELNLNDPRYLAQPDEIRQELLNRNAGRSAIDDPEALRALQALQEQGSAALANVNMPEDYWARLSPTTYDQWFGLVRAAREDAAEYAALQTELATTNTLIAGMGVDSSDDPYTAQRLRELFRLEGARRREAGELWGDVQARQYADSLMEEVQVARRIAPGPSRVPRWQVLVGTSTYQLEVPGVPEDAAALIAQALAEAGVPITPEAIQATYQAAGQE